MVREDYINFSVILIARFTSVYRQEVTFPFDFRDRVVGVAMSYGLGDRGVKFESR
jgi:hypothetical protein